MLYHSIMDTEQRLRNIEERNQRVEAEKAWEVSIFRRAVIAGITYVFAVLFLQSIASDKPFLSGLIPVVGYLLSTLSLPPLKRWWMEKR